MMNTRENVVLDKDMHEGGFGEMGTYKKVDAVRNLERACEDEKTCVEIKSADELLQSESVYISVSKLCVSRFNDLRAVLSKNQLTYLLAYEEAIAIEEGLIKDILLRNQNSIRGV